ncbi:XTP/dITP diphosphatase [Clostridium isatidis]|uniref:dITP/XTP pyrophosphatase n=1 Tax=Clostridium isatidis TaxID=182773 RepID=A0A343JF10_9CLOT|nr:XTP/dITP diphosphatase [Clostridium isatidis]ASW44118.1 non-canonical purine NTP pyrophosphatase, RdgB/HAM1 family [Clostridium isatidis]NLZ34403.1 XTP/dITP diphosphatase [Clostridiales bacterium]
MKKLVLASNNSGKIKEMKELLRELSIEVLSLKDMGIDINVVEDGTTFEENSRKKAEEIYDELIKNNESNFIVMADDSGLEVDYLNGEPGVYSARYAGEDSNDKKNNEKLINNLKGVPLEERRARFVCHISLVYGNKEYIGVNGIVEGYILEEARGEGGFGYDPLFFYKPYNKTFSEMTMEEKNKISHRGIALRKVIQTIKGLL